MKPLIRLYEAKGDLSKKWFVSHYLEGKRKRVYGNINQGKTVEERRALAQIIIDDLNEVPPDITTIKEKCFNNLHARHGRWRKKTYQSYKSKLVNFWRWIGEREPTPELCKQFFNELGNTKHPTTHNDYLVMLRRLFKPIGQESLFDGITRIKSKYTPARYFQEHQIKRIKNYVIERDPDLWFFIQFIYYCFIRPGELRLLRVGDIHFEERRILLRSEVSKNRMEQYVAIPAPFLPAIIHLKRLSPNQLIFPSSTDQTKPCGVNTYSGRHRKVLRALDFGSQYKLYSWKHTGAVMAVKAGIGVKALQLQLRHHSLDQVNEYLRQLGVGDLEQLEKKFPEI
ncbi:MAG: site-specific integrase [Saprospiraceae bacterium]|nr:site-specific integrase [Saprospiraceae bacterium]